MGRRGPRVPTILVICSCCQRELAGTPSVHGTGFYVRRHRDHRDGLSGSWCWGPYRTDHQPVVVHADDVNPR
jgi:hypothetical protein